MKVKMAWTKINGLAASHKMPKNEVWGLEKNRSVYSGFFMFVWLTRLLQTCVNPQFFFATGRVFVWYFHRYSIVLVYYITIQALYKIYTSTIQYTNRSWLYSNRKIRAPYLGSWAMWWWWYPLPCTSFSRHPTEKRFRPTGSWHVKGYHLPMGSMVSPGQTFGWNIMIKALWL